MCLHFAEDEKRSQKLHEHFFDVEKNPLIEPKHSVTVFHTVLSQTPWRGLFYSAKYSPFHGKGCNHAVSLHTVLSINGYTW